MYHAIGIYPPETFQTNGAVKYVASSSIVDFFCLYLRLEVYMLIGLVEFRAHSREVEHMAN